MDRFLMRGGGLTVDLLQRDDAVALTRAAPSLTASYQIHGFFRNLIQFFGPAFSRTR